SSSATRTSRPDGKRIRARRSIGPGCGGCSPSGLEDAAMKLIALILGLGLERIATALLELRELRWFDRYFDAAVRRASRAEGALRYGFLRGALLLLLLPVWGVSHVLYDGGAWDLVYLLFAVLVVFFCLGPRDLATEVADYRAALDRGDEERARQVLTELAESAQPHAVAVEVVEEAVFVQATNRIFAVVLWFVVLGPVGAWLFRVNDLFRRRVAFEAARDPAARPAAS